jgi:hypothetical protein
MKISHVETGAHQGPNHCAPGTTLWTMYSTENIGVSRETGRYCRNKRGDIWKSKFLSFETNCKKRSIRDMYRGVNEFKKSNQRWTNFDEMCDLADSHIFLTRWKDHFVSYWFNDGMHTHIRTAEPPVPEPCVLEVDMALAKIWITRCW